MQNPKKLPEVGSEWTTHYTTLYTTLTYVVEKVVGTTVTIRCLQLDNVHVVSLTTFYNALKPLETEPFDDGLDNWI